MMQRQIRYIEITAVDVLASLISTTVAISMALSGYGYWSLVAGAIVTPAVSAGSFWMLTKWVPSWPDRVTDVRALVRFGSTVVVNNLLVHAAYNAEKVLLGRYWGAEALGLYGRASQIINIPTAQINGSIGGVAFAALARVQNDTLRFKRYFLMIYFVVISLTAPVTLFSAAFAPEVIVVALGNNWTEAIPIFLMLTPTVLIFGIINPMAWLLQASGRHVRSLAIACAIVPICLVAYLVGIPYGPTGVAVAYSVALTAWLVPHLMWCLKDTPITFAEIMHTIWRPILAACMAAAIAFALKHLAGQSLSPLALLLIGGCVMFSLYAFLLLAVFGGWSTAISVLDALGWNHSIRRRLPSWVGGIQGRVISE
jgi:PST family polysaccharide transporter